MCMQVHSLAPLKSSAFHYLRLSATAVILAASSAVVFAQAQGTDPVIAKVNGVEIHQKDLELAAEDAGGNIPATTDDAKRDYLIGYLSDLILLSQAAEAKNVQNSDDFKQRYTFARKKVLMELLLVNEGKHAVTDEGLHKVYEEAAKQISSEEEVHARHILIRVTDPKDEKASKDAEAKIKTVIERLKKGEDFSAVAKEITEDPSGKDNGGDLGYFTKDQMVPEFSTVAFTLDKGKLSEPIKTQFGWHVLKVEDKRNRQAPEFDKVKDQLVAYVTRKAQVDLVTKLRSEAKIERLDKPAGGSGAPAMEQKK